MVSGPGTVLLGPRAVDPLPEFAVVAGTQALKNLGDWQRRRRHHRGQRGLGLKALSANGRPRLKGLRANERTRKRE